MSQTTRFFNRRVQVALLLTLLTVGYCAVNYVDVGKLLNVGYYRMSIKLSDASDLYPGSLVTLRGVQVGTVTGLDPSAQGVVAHLQLKDGTGIPQGSPAVLDSLSAAGEQYLNFEPTTTTDAGPVYAAGSVIPETTVHTQISTARLLTDVNTLLRTLPVGDLHTTLHEVGSGLANGGVDMRTFLDSLLPLQQTFTSNLAPTTRLIAAGRTVLNTQAVQQNNIKAAAANLAAFTAQLSSSDAELRRVLASTPGMDTQLQRTIAGIAPNLPTLLKSTAQVGQVTSTFDKGIRQTLTVFPGLLGALKTAVDDSPVKGSVSLFARSVVQDPAACTNGFVQERRSPRDLTPIAPPTNVWCKVTGNSPQAVRGARNDPCPTSTLRGATATLCGLIFESPAEVAQVQRQALATQVASADKYLAGAAAGNPSYNPLAGLGTLPTGASGISRSPGTSAPTSSNWQSLLLGPLGL